MDFSNSPWFIWSRNASRSFIQCKNFKNIPFSLRHCNLKIHNKRNRLFSANHTLSYLIEGKDSHFLGQQSLICSSIYRTSLVNWKNYKTQVGITCEWLQKTIFINLTWTRKSVILKQYQKTRFQTFVSAGNDWLIINWFI